MALPVDFWAQFVMAAEHEQPNLEHLIIENANCYATPERAGGLLKLFVIAVRVWAQSFQQPDISWEAEIVNVNCL